MGKKAENESDRSALTPFRMGNKTLTWEEFDKLHFSPSYEHLVELANAAERERSAPYTYQATSNKRLWRFDRNMRFIPEGN